MKERHHHPCRNPQRKKTKRGVLCKNSPGRVSVLMESSHPNNCRAENDDTKRMQSRNERRNITMSNQSKYSDKGKLTSEFLPNPSFLSISIIS